jgi:hypothetical protein
MARQTQWAAAAGCWLVNWRQERSFEHENTTEFQKSSSRCVWCFSPHQGWLVGISYAVSAANPQLCPGARHGRQPTRCRCDSAPPHFTLERAICPQRPGVVWLLSTTMYFSSLEVTSFVCVCVPRTIIPYVCRTQSLVCSVV